MLNQTQFGAPQGSGVDISPLSEALNSFLGKRKEQGKDLQKMAGQYALDTMRDTRKHEMTKELEGMRQAHAVGMQERGIAHAQKEGSAKRRHEKGMLKLSQAHELDKGRLDIAGSVLKQNTAFEGIERLGKGKRVSSFKATADGGMEVAYNRPVRRRSSTTPGQPTQVAPTTPQRSTETPEPPKPTTSVAPVIRDPKTGRATRNPAYTPAAKPAPKAARAPRKK